MSDADKIRLVVDIFGVQYTLITDSDEFHAKKMASMVDDLLKKNYKASPRLETYRLAVLSAMQLADQNIQLQRELELAQENLQELTNDPAKIPAFQKLREDYQKLRQSFNELKNRTDK